MQILYNKMIFKHLFPIFLICFTASYGAADNNPGNAGGTMGLDAGGTPVDALSMNPANLGTQRVPNKGAAALPFSSYGMGYSSDALEIPIYLKYMDIAIEEGFQSFNRILREGMGVERLGDSAAIKRIRTKFPQGASLYGGTQVSIAGLCLKRFAVNLNLEGHTEISFPQSGLIEVGTDSALVQPELFSSSGFKINSQWNTNLDFAAGFPVVSTPINKFLRLPKTAAGVRLSYIMGHSYLKTEEDSALNGFWYGKYKSAGAGMSFDGFRSPVNGHGWDADIGAIWYGGHASLSILAEHIGKIYWIRDIAKENFSIGPGWWDANAWAPPKSADTTDTAGFFKTTRPFSLSAAYSYKWNVPENKWDILHYFAHYLYGAADLSQVFVPSVNETAGTRFSTGITIGAFRGMVPVRMGWKLGGSEKISSVIGIGLYLGYPSLDISFKSVGSLIFNPKRGYELSGALTWMWGLDRDWDNDRVIDKNDKCPDSREDHDGFEDSNGCADLDNDADSIADCADECPDSAEDYDGFMDFDGCPEYNNDNDSLSDRIDDCPDDAEDYDDFLDGDGCPDLDNDMDSVPDRADACPDTAEDFDNFRDADGCPEFDNDNDGLLDTVDSCVNNAEDMDNFEDQNGCPDFDNDKDSIWDISDSCPDIPEILNGYNDEDGCPDSIVMPDTVKTEQLPPDTSNSVFELPLLDIVADSVAKPVNDIMARLLFRENVDILKPGMRVFLDSAVSVLQSLCEERFEIQGHCDSIGTSQANMKLSIDRARIVFKYLTACGVDGSRLVCVGYGEERPVASNNTEEGRAANRRVMFNTVESGKQWNELREIEVKQTERFQNHR